MDYWEECIKEAFEDAKISASDEQIQNVIGWVESAYENHSMATGNDIVSANFISDEKRELDELKKDLEKKRIWELETLPCAACCTTGQVKDDWDRIKTCGNCNGKGRQKKLLRSKS